MSFLNESELFATIGEVNFSIREIDEYIHQNAEPLIREIKEMEEKFVLHPMEQSELPSLSLEKKPEKKTVQKTTKKAGKNDAKKAGKKGRRPKKTIPEEILEKAGLYNHKPARGRGRRIQLESMTEEQIRAEEEAKLERNRTAARQCRLRKKEYVESLEKRATYLQKENDKLKAILCSLEM